MPLRLLTYKFFLSFVTKIAMISLSSLAKLRPASRPDANKTVEYASASIDFDVIMVTEAKSLLIGYPVVGFKI